MIIRRGDGTRYEVSVPVTIAFVPAISGEEVSDETAPMICMPLVNAGAMAGTGVDISERGMQIHISGPAAKELLGQDLTVRNALLEVRFAAKELAAAKVCMARARWSRVWLERGTWVLGIRFDLPLGSEILKRIVPQAPPPVGAGFPYRWIAGALAACLLVVGGFQGYKAQAASQAELTERVSAQEKETSELRGQLQQCQTVVASRAVPTASPVRLSEDAGAAEAADASAE